MKFGKNVFFLSLLALSTGGCVPSGGENSAAGGNGGKIAEEDSRPSSPSPISLENVTGFACTTSQGSDVQISLDVLESFPPQSIVTIKNGAKVTNLNLVITRQKVGEGANFTGQPFQDTGASPALRLTTTDMVTAEGSLVLAESGKPLELNCRIVSNRG